MQLELEEEKNKQWLLLEEKERQEAELLEKEKRSVTRIWKAREKHIQNSVNGASMLAGQLETILGASVVNQIGFEKFDVLEIIEDEETDND